MAHNQVVEVDSFQPNYQRRCINCGQSPTVYAVKDAEVVYDSEMCGPCTWGEAAMLDPANWNKPESE